MSIINGVYTKLVLTDVLSAVIADAPGIVFAPGNPPELIIANMLAQAEVDCDTNNGETLAALMTPVGAMIDLQNPNNPRQGAIATIGTLKLSQSTGSPIAIPANTIFTASNGGTYTNGATAFTVVSGVPYYSQVTCTVPGIGGNIPAGLTFTALGNSNITMTNPITWVNGADAETDIVYSQRLTKEKTGYGALAASAATETALQKLYTATQIYVNSAVNASTTPVPLPGNGYNVVVLTPNGILENAAIMAGIFSVLNANLELVNAEASSSVNGGGFTTHKVLSGTVYDGGVPLAYYYTAAQNVAATITASINVRFTAGTDATERLAQSVDFATYFINRLMSFFSGVAGNTTIIFTNDAAVSTDTVVAIAASGGVVDPIAPQFGIAEINALATDSTTRTLTPQLMYDSTGSLTMVLNPGVTGEASITMTLGSPTNEFVNFETGSLFTDGTSWFDRFMSLNPASISVTVVDIS